MSRTKHSDNDGKGEFLSGRSNRFAPVGRWTKDCTHRNERRNARQSIRQLLDEIESDREVDIEDAIDLYDDEFYFRAMMDENIAWLIVDDDDVYQDDDYDLYDDWDSNYQQHDDYKSFHSDYLSKELTKANLKIHELERQLKILSHQ